MTLDTALDNLASSAGSLAFWISKAEAGETFDSVGLCGHGRTRARFDGKQLELGHWVDSSPLALIEMRLGDGGQWRARLAPCALSRTYPANQVDRALSDIESAFCKLPPQEPCGLARKLLWPR